MDLIATTEEHTAPKSLQLRCPVHRYIVFESPMMRALINTKAFQRLRGITQLGACTKVFPAANHTRFDHCLGVAHLCLQYAKHFERIEGNLMILLPGECAGNMQDLLAAAGLLHDIAHGPFSHDWDRAVYCKLYPDTDKGHDLVREMLISQDDEIKDALSMGNLTPTDIINAWHTRPFSQMISGPLSADQMDYICRDSQTLGTQHFGGVDPIRMISNAVITNSNDRRFRKNCKTDIEIFMNTRRLAYDHVYLHPKVQQYSEILKKMMTKLLEADPTILKVDMQSASHLVKWTETYFFHRYLQRFGEKDPLYLQWTYRVLE